MIIKPTVGRMVWYWPSPGDNVTGNDGDQPMAAQIAHVWSDTCVNLGILDADGKPFHKTSVRLVQEGDERPASGFAEWMPYQKGQAAKIGQLEAQFIATVPASCGETPV